MEKRRKRQLLDCTGSRSLNSACRQLSCIGRLSVDLRQRQAEQTACACTNRNQPSVMAVGGLRPRQLALINEKSQSKQRHGAAKERRRIGGRKSKQPPNHLQPKPSSVQSAVESAHHESDSTATNHHVRTDRQPFQILVCEESTIIIIIIVVNRLTDSQPRRSYEGKKTNKQTNKKNTIKSYCKQKSDSLL